MDNKKNKLKVFQMNDCDCYADYSKEEAIKHYMYYSDLTESDIEVNEVKQISEEELEEMKIVFIDEPGTPVLTFKEHLQNFKCPDFFSSTEY